MVKKKENELIWLSDKTPCQLSANRETDPQQIFHPIHSIPHNTVLPQGEYDIALVDGEGIQLYFGSFLLSQVQSVEVCFTLSHAVH